MNFLPFLSLLFLTTFIHFPTTSAYEDDLLEEKQSFTNLLESHNYYLEEYHVTPPDDEDMTAMIITMHRVVPRDFGDPLDYAKSRKPILIMNGILTDSSVYYLNSEFLQANDSFCSHNFGFCLLQSGNYDLWILNSVEPANFNSTKYIPLSNTDQKRFWMSSLDTFSKDELTNAINLIQEHTGNLTSVAFLGFSQASESMFGLMSVQQRNLKAFHPFIKLVKARFLGKSGSFLATLTPLFKKIPGVFIPAQALSKLLMSLPALPKEDKVCAVLVLKTPPPTSIQSSKYSLLYSKKSRKNRLTKYVPVNFDVVLMYGNHDWITVLITLEQMVEVLRLNGENVIEYGCLKTKENVHNKRIVNKVYY